MQVKLKKRGSDKKLIAKVLAIGTECDLALLSVEDEKFFENINTASWALLSQSCKIAGHRGRVPDWWGCDICYEWCCE